MSDVEYGSDGEPVEYDSDGEKVEYDEEGEPIVLIERLLDRLHDNDPRLTCFYRSSQPLNWDNMHSLVRGMATNTHVTEVSIGACLQDDPDLIYPFAYIILPGHLTLSTLYLSNCFLEPAHGVAIGRALSTNFCLSDLELYGNYLQDDGVVALSKGLYQNKRTCLHSLTLDDNCFGDAGFESLATLLRTNKTLAYLLLNGNKTSVVGADAFAAGLRENKTLETLELSQCFAANPNAIRSLIETVIPNHPSLSSLRLDSNNLAKAHARWIARVLAKNTNRTLEYLNLDDNSIGDRGARAFARGLCPNSSLKCLRLSNNGIGEKGIQALASALRHSNHTLEYLHCGSKHNGDTPSDILRLNDDTPSDIQNLCSANRRVKKVFAQLKGVMQIISHGLWPRALGLVSQKPDLLYSMIKSIPQIIPDRRNNVRRTREEAFGEND